MRRALLAALATLGAAHAAGEAPADAPAPPRPVPTLVGSYAPALDGVTWADGRAPDLRGRVAVVHWFSTADEPAGTASLAEAAKRWAGERDVAVVAVQWLGWKVEPVGTAEDGAARLARAGLAPSARGTLLGTRETGALAPNLRWGATSLPWTAVLDRAGVIRAEGGARSAARLRTEVESMRILEGTPNPLVGQRFDVEGALRTQDGTPFSFRGKPFTLLRWWTNRCPHCTGSVPALARLSAKHAPRGLRFVGVYHPKGANLSDEGARAYAAGLGHAGTVVFDDRWTAYVALRDRGHLGSATSISVLVDEDGIVRWVHPGPRIEEGSADLATLDALLGRLLPGGDGAGSR